MTKLTLEGGSFEFALPSRRDIFNSDWYGDQWLKAPRLRIRKREDIESGMTVMVDSTKFSFLNGQHEVGPNIEDHDDGTMTIKLLPVCDIK